MIGALNLSDRNEGVGLHSDGAKNPKPRVPSGNRIHPPIGYGELPGRVFSKVSKGESTRDASSLEITKLFING